MNAMEAPKTILSLAAALTLFAINPTLKTVDQAIAEASSTPVEAGPYSVWRWQYPGKNEEEVDTGYVHNLFTTGASGYTNGYDWTSKAMGAGPSGAFADAASAATSTTAISLTKSTASFPTAGQGLAGCIVVACPNSSGTGSKVYGIIASNTGTALTVDQWYDPTSTTGAAGTTPNATASYVILPGQNPAAWLAVTSSSFTPANTDTTLSGELTSNGFTRAVGTWAHTAAASTYTLVHLWTATGTQTINNEAVFGAANTTAGGVMPFESAEPSPPTLVSGDTLQNTITVTV
jgi:hypothetical protein